MTLPCKPCYRTINWKQYSVALKARGLLTVWLDKRMSWFAAASGKRGRSPKFSDAAIQFCLTLKNLFGLALRQTTGLVQSVLQLCGLTWLVPDFSTLCRRQLNLNVQVPYTRSQAGLHLLVDSTGINFLGEGECKCKKHGPERCRQWRKVHLGTDAQTLQTRAIVVTTNEVGDSPVATELLSQVPSPKSQVTRRLSVSQVMEPMTRRMFTRLVTSGEPFPSSHLAKEHGCVKGWHLHIAMRLSKHASALDALSGSAGAATTAEACWKPT